MSLHLIIYFTYKFIFPYAYPLSLSVYSLIYLFMHLFILFILSSIYLSIHAIALRNYQLESTFVELTINWSCWSDNTGELSFLLLYLLYLIYPFYFSTSLHLYPLFIHSSIHRSINCVAADLRVLLSFYSFFIYLILYIHILP